MATQDAKKPHLTTDSAARKNMPIATGVIDYFPDALAAVAEVSKVGNDKHNPGEPLHWAREKSTDHADCIARHLIDRGHIDDDGGRHSAKLAWRALALLQVEIEADRAKAAPPKSEARWSMIEAYAVKEWRSVGSPDYAAWFGIDIERLRELDKLIPNDAVPTLNGEQTEGRG
jgi:hypothetical protein